MVQAVDVRKMWRHVSLSGFHALQGHLQNLCKLTHFLLVPLVLVVAAPLSFPAHAATGAPVISKIDPPNWWIRLPDPILLVKGENLRNARFTLAGTSASIRSVHASDNGKWAFLDLSLKGAHDGTFKITASNAAGTASASYTLAVRRTDMHAPLGFSSDDVMYLIMTDRFADGDPTNDRQPNMLYDRADPGAWHGGDIRGVHQHLDYIQNLGATAVWLTPLYENREARSYHGYGATDMYRIDDHFGTVQDIQRLSDDLHSRHMKFVLDMVPNHVGPAHPWASDPPTSDWFHGTQANHREASGDFEALMDPNASAAQRQNVLNGWFVDLLPDLNQSNPLVSRYLIQNTIWWIETTDADGLRLDTFPYVDREFWGDFHRQLKALYPHLTTVGEVFNGKFALPPALNAFFAGGVTQVGRTKIADTGLWTPFDYPFYAVVRNVLVHGAPMSDLALLFGQDTLYPHPERLATLIGSHDTKRFLGEIGATAAELRLAFGLLLTVRGMPVIYAGDEIGMSGGDDPDNRRDFPGGFPSPDRPLDFDAFKGIGGTPLQRSINEWVRKVLAVRSHVPELRDGEQQIEQSDDDTITYVRGNALQSGCARSRPRVLVTVNRSTEARQVVLQQAESAIADCHAAETLLGISSVEISPAKLMLTVQPESVSIVRLN
jgi:neopullulanase